MIDFINEQRKLRGINKQDFCKDICSVSTYNRYLDNSVNIPYVTVLELLNKLGYDIAIALK